MIESQNIGSQQQLQDQNRNNTEQINDNIQQSNNSNEQDIDFVKYQNLNSFGNQNDKIHVIQPQESNQQQNKPFQKKNIDLQDMENSLDNNPPKTINNLESSQISRDNKTTQNNLINNSLMISNQQQYLGDRKSSFQNSSDQKGRNYDDLQLSQNSQNISEGRQRQDSIMNNPSITQNNLDQSNNANAPPNFSKFSNNNQPDVNQEQDEQIDQNQINLQKVESVQITSQISQDQYQQQQLIDSKISKVDSKIINQDNSNNNSPVKKINTGLQSSDSDTNFQSQAYKRRSQLFGTNQNKNFASLDVEQQHQWLVNYLLSYDPEKKPFDLGQALNHQKASRVYTDDQQGFTTTYFGSLESNACPCCNQPLQGNLIPLMSPYEAISHLGPAYPLYFKFLQQAVYFLFILFILNGIPMIVQNLMDNKCDKHEHEDKKDLDDKCTVSFIQTFATSNRSEDDPTTVDIIFNFLCCLTLMTFVLFQYRKSLKKLEKEVDVQDISVSDYSLMISHIPKDTSKEEIQKFFEGLKDKINFDVDVKQAEKQIHEFEKNRSHHGIKDRVEAGLDRIQSIVIEDPNFKKDKFEGMEEGEKLDNSIKVEKIILTYEIKYFVQWQNRLEQIELSILDNDQLKTDLEDQKEQNNNIQEFLNKFKLPKFLDYDNIRQNLNIQDKNLQSEKKELIRKIKKFQRQCLNKAHTDKSNKKEMSHFTGTAFISFRQEKHAIMIKEYFDYGFIQKYLWFLNPLKEKMFKGKKLTVKFAPEPGAVIWENLGRDTLTKIIRRVITFFLTIFILGVCFISILGISVGQKELTEDGANFIVTFLVSCSSSIVIMIINNILSTMITKFAQYEIFSSITQYQASIAKKLGVAQFINTAIITFFVNLIVHGDELFVDGGLVNDIMTLMLLDTIVPPLMNFIDVGWILSKYLPRQYYIKYPEKRIQLSQKKANSLFEDRKLDPSQRFANVIKTLLFASFYAYLIPLGSLLTVVSLIFQHWMEWFLILRYQSVPIPIGAELIKEMVDFYIEFLIVAFSLGCLIFEQLIYKEVQWITWLQLALSCVYWTLPMDQILVKLFGFEDEANKDEAEQNYEESKQRLKFTQDYDRSNPVTQAEALKEYLTYEFDHCHKEPRKVRKSDKQLSQLMESQNNDFQQQDNGNQQESLTASELKQQKQLSQLALKRLKKLKTLERDQEDTQDLKQKLQFFKNVRQNNTNLIYIREQQQNKWKKNIHVKRIQDYFDTVTRVRLIGRKKPNWRNSIQLVQNLNKIKLGQIAPIEEDNEEEEEEDE